MMWFLLASLLAFSIVLAQESQPLTEEEYKNLKLHVQNDLGAKLEELANGSKYTYAEAHSYLEAYVMELASSKDYAKQVIPLLEHGNFEEFLKDVHKFCRVKLGFKKMLAGQKAAPGKFGGDEICPELYKEDGEQPPSEHGDESSKFEEHHDHEDESSKDEEHHGEHGEESSKEEHHGEHGEESSKEGHHGEHGEESSKEEHHGERGEESSKEEEHESGE